MRSMRSNTLPQLVLVTVLFVLASMLGATLLGFRFDSNDAREQAHQRHHGDSTEELESEPDGDGGLEDINIDVGAHTIFDSTKTQEKARDLYLRVSELLEKATKRSEGEIRTSRGVNKQHAPQRRNIPLSIHHSDLNHKVYFYLHG